MANAYGVTPRTIRNWQGTAKAGLPPKSLGRPPHKREEVDQVKALASAIISDEGYSIGECRLHRTLKVPRRIARIALAELKAEHRALVAEGEKNRRMTIEMRAKDVIWAQDSTELERIEDAVVTTEVVREVATTATGGVNPNLGASNAEAAVAAFDAMSKSLGGRRPLIAATDRGAQYKSKTFNDMLRTHQVVHLLNVPHTPQHNAFAERAVRELKQESGLVPWETCEFLRPIQGWKRRTKVALRRLHARHRSGSRQGMNSTELDKHLRRADDLVDRSVFYAAAQEALAAARQAHEEPRARQCAERRAIINVLLRYGLIRVWIGGVPVAEI